MCLNCGSSHPPKKCKAYGKKCFHCHKKGHFSQFCCSKQHGKSLRSNVRSSSQNNRFSSRDVHEIDQSQFDDSIQFKQDLITIQFVMASQTRHTNVMFDEISSIPSLQGVLTNVQVKPIGINQLYWTKKCFKIDSGACGNLMPLSMYMSMYNHVPSATSVNSAVHLLDYNKREIKQLGTCVVSAKYRSNVKQVPFYVVSDKLKPILGVSDALALGLTSFHCPIYTDWQSGSVLTISVDSIHSNAGSTLHTGTGTASGIVNSPTQEFTIDTLMKQAIFSHPKYASLFSGIGHFRCSPVHITMRWNASPVQKPPRMVPIAMKDKFKQELDAIESQGIISKYDGHDISPEWLNSFVIVRKPNGSLRICLDLTDLNKDIIRPICNSQTMDDVVHRLKGAKFFAVFDTSKGFFHIPLDQESKLLTAMLTRFGIYVYNVLAMGLSNATDLFETCIREVLQGLNGCTNITTDILVYGSTYDEFKTNVLAFLGCCVQEDMHLNPDKVKKDCHEVPFFGNILSKDGLSPDTRKVELIQQWPTPTNHKVLSWYSKLSLQIF